MKEISSGTGEVLPPVVATDTEADPWEAWEQERQALQDKSRAYQKSITANTPPADCSDETKLNPSDNRSSAVYLSEQEAAEYYEQESRMGNQVKQDLGIPLKPPPVPNPYNRAGRPTSVPTTSSIGDIITESFSSGRFSSRFQQLLGRFKCFNCGDTGVLNKQDMTILKYEDVEKQHCLLVHPDQLGIRQSCKCDLGEMLLARWHEQNAPDCSCNYGAISPGVFCTNCQEGQRLRQEMESRIFRYTQLKFEQKQTQLGLGELRYFTFDTFISEAGTYLTPQEANQLEAAREIFLEAANSPQGRSIFLVGQTGTGKTHLIAAYLNRWLARGRTGEFISLVDLMAELKKTIGKDGPSWDDIIDKYLDTGLLVLDDLSQEVQTDRVVETVYRLINGRMVRGLPTVISGNYPLEVMAARGMYNEAVISRLRRFYRVVWDVRDWRMKTEGNFSRSTQSPYYN